MKELIKKIDNKEEFFKKLLGNLFGKKDLNFKNFELNIDDINHNIYTDNTQNIILIDDLTLDKYSGISVLQDKEIIDKLQSLFDVQIDLNTIFVHLYVDNRELLIIQAFSFDSLFCGEFQNPKTHLFNALSKDYIQKIMEQK